MCLQIASNGFIHNPMGFIQSNFDELAEHEKEISSILM